MSKSTEEILRNACETIETLSICYYQLAEAQQKVMQMLETTQNEVQDYSNTVALLRDELDILKNSIGPQ